MKLTSTSSPDTTYHAITLTEAQWWKIQLSLQVTQDCGVIDRASLQVIKTHINNYIGFDN